MEFCTIIQVWKLFFKFEENQATLGETWRDLFYIQYILHCLFLKCFGRLNILYKGKAAIAEQLQKRPTD